MILCVEVSHQTTPVSVREKLSFSNLDLVSALQQFKAMPRPCGKGLSELVMLSTCNRLLVCARVNEEHVQDSPQEPIQTLIHFIAMMRDIPVREIMPHAETYINEEAVDHLCRVAAGLESQIVGEPQILGQMTRAYEMATAHKSIGVMLDRLWRMAIRVGKRTRTETAISRNPASISTVSVRLGEQLLGDLTARQIVIIGLGKMGQLALQILQSKGATNLALLNRTYSQAANMAAKHGVKAYGFDRLSEVLNSADLIITATGAPHPIITTDMFTENERIRPLVIIDLAVPRDVEPAVQQLPQIELYDMDVLTGHLDEGLQQRQQAIPAVERIIQEEFVLFEEALRELEIRPTIADLRQKAETIRQHELNRMLRHLPDDLDMKTRQQLELFSRSLINKLLHEPMKSLRREANNGHAKQYAATVRDLFQLGNE